jgi:RNA polymerase sigma-70 factor (ECF subfamily)
MRGGTSVSEAEELAQEVMLRVWNRAHSYDPRRAAVSTWIFTIARNLRIDRIRKMKRVDVDPQDPAMVASDAPSPERGSQLRERSRAVRAELQSLPQAQAEILSAMYYQGRSQAELAAELGLALGTVKSRVRLATQTLRGCLDRFQVAPDGEAQ